jgi:uncharacterized membrane protein
MLSPNTPRTLQHISVATLIGLIVLCVAWELWLAPLRPGGSWLVIKVFPLLAPLGGLVAGRRYTFQWTSLLILAYLTEGLVRATSDQGFSQVLAGIETILALVLFVTVVGYARLTAKQQKPRT